ncbi:MAG: glycine dehydrogenase (aminomethyl-transferring), partial [Nonlabens sp.]|nr:glycine dehydrogenase (aminomethyl-transferring) [Nonlabens sp.]
MNTDSFALRHIGPRPADLQEMLDTIGVDSIEQLIYETVPAGIRLQKELELDPAMSEYEFLKHIQELGNKNKQFRSFIGLGYNAAIIPAVIQRNILENPGWYTAYTPYQAEIAQGRLEALLNYQTMITDLTGMELSNASLLDESTAAAEAMTLLLSVRESAQKKAGAVKFFVDENCLPQTKELLKTRAIPLDIELVVGNPLEMDMSDLYYGVLLQYPGASGRVIDYTAFAKACHNKNIRIAVAADILSLVLLEAPGHWGADVFVG